jgi:hypothetical protein
MSPRAFMDRRGIFRPYQNSIPGPISPYTVATLTTLTGSFDYVASSYKICEYRI